MSPREPTGGPNGRPPKDVGYHLIGDFSLTFEEAKAGIDRAVERMTTSQYREFIDRLMRLGPDQVEIVEIDENGKHRKLRPDEYPCNQSRAK